MYEVITKNKAKENLNNLLHFDLFFHFNEDELKLIPGGGFATAMLEAAKGIIKAYGAADLSNQRYLAYKMENSQHFIYNNFQKWLFNEMPEDWAPGIMALYLLGVDIDFLVTNFGSLR